MSESVTISADHYSEKSRYGSVLDISYNFRSKIFDVIEKDYPFFLKYLASARVIFNILGIETDELIYNMGLPVSRVKSYVDQLIKIFEQAKKLKSGVTLG